MLQSKKGSFLEQVAAASLKFLTAMACWQFIVAPLWGWDIPIIENAQITAIFFVNSIFFGYWIRRLFNWWQVTWAKRHPSS